MSPAMSVTALSTTTLLVLGRDSGHGCLDAVVDFSYKSMLGHVQSSFDHLFN